MPCEYIFRRGKNSGSHCGKNVMSGMSGMSGMSVKYCSSHVQKVLDLKALPGEILHIIVDYLVASKIDDAKKLDRLEALEQTCKEFRSIVTGKYEALYAALSVAESSCKDVIMTRRGLSHKARCSLLMRSGCQNCNAPRITKIHWPFPTRLCSECINDIIVADYVLPTEYCVHNYNNRECLQRQTYSRYHGASSYRLFLRSDVERSIGYRLHEFPGVYAAQVATWKGRLADTLETTVDALKLRSMTFVNNDMPDFDRVSTEHWQSLTKEALILKVLKISKAKLNIDKVFPREAGMMSRVSNAQDLCSYKARLTDEYVAGEIERHQNSTYVKNAAVALLRKLRESQYFACLTELPPIIASIVKKAEECRGQDTKDSISEAKAQVQKFVYDHEPDGATYFADPVCIKLFKAAVRHPNKTPTDYALFAKMFMREKGYVYERSLPATFANWQHVVDFTKDESHPYKSCLCAYNVELAKMFDAHPYFMTFPESEKLRFFERPESDTLKKLDKDIVDARMRVYVFITDRLPPRSETYFPGDGIAKKLFHASVRYPDMVPEHTTFLSKYLALSKLDNVLEPNLSCWDDMVKYIEDKTNFKNHLGQSFKNHLGQSRCLLCGAASIRLFTHVGLRDHTIAKHK